MTLLDLSWRPSFAWPQQLLPPSGEAANASTRIAHAPASHPFSIPHGVSSWFSRWFPAGLTGEPAPPPPAGHGPWTDRDDRLLSGKLTEWRSRALRGKIDVPTAIVHCIALHEMLVQPHPGHPQAGAAQQAHRERVIGQIFETPEQTAARIAASEPDPQTRQALVQRALGSQRGRIPDTGPAPDAPPHEPLDFVRELHGSASYALAVRRTPQGRHVVTKQALTERAARALEADWQVYRRVLETTSGVLHPGLLRLYDLHERPGAQGQGKTVTLSMEEVPGLDGIDLAERIDAAITHGLVNAPWLAVVMPYLLDGLADVAAWLHATGHAFNDFKPDNFIVTPWGEIVVVDWGGVAPIDEPARACTLHYLAPERRSQAALCRRSQLLKGVDPREVRSTGLGSAVSDGYSIGRTLAQIASTWPEGWLDQTGLRPVLDALLAKDRRERADPLAARLGSGLAGRDPSGAEARRLLRGLLAERAE